MLLNISCCKIATITTSHLSTPAAIVALDDDEDGHPLSQLQYIKSVTATTYKSGGPPQIRSPSSSTVIIMSSRKDDPVFNVKFVQLVESKPCLWNSTLPEYSKKDEIQKAWQEVANETKDTGK